MADRIQIGSLIERLFDPNPHTRNESLRAIHREGVSLFTDTLKNWSAEPEFANLLRRVHSGSERLNSPSEAIVVGIAVMPEIFDRIRSANGNAPLSSVPPQQDALEFELFLDVGVNIDVLTSREPEGSGAIARYLKKFGGGIQQVELYVRNVDRATEILRSRFSVVPIYNTTQIGAEGTRVNFFLVPASDEKKLLVELVQAQH